MVHSCFPARLPRVVIGLVATLATLATVAALATGCGPIALAPADDAAADATPAADAPAAPDATPDAGTTPPGDSGPVTVPDAAPAVDAGPGAEGFVPAMHAPLPQFPNNGGRVLSSPQLVTVTFSDFLYTDAVENWGDWVVASDWLRTVGEEYGVGVGAHVAKVRLPQAAPTAISDAEIQAWLLRSLADHTLPSPATLDGNQYVYTIYYPESTTVTLMGTQSCTGFTGYHNSVSNGTATVAYAVVATCPTAGRVLMQPDALHVAASHEFIEAATDADPLSEPAYKSDPSGPDPSPWAVIYGEIADVCTGNFDYATPFVSQTVWSNRIAAQGGNPCVPNADLPYFNVSASPEQVQRIAAGQTVVIPLTGWSTAPVADWSVSAIFAGGNFHPTASLDVTQMNNGGMANLTVTVPAGTRSRSTAAYTIYSNAGMAGRHSYPIVITVP